MASIDTPEVPLKYSSEPSEYKSRIGLFVDIVLRVFLFAAALIAIIVMVTSKQTKMIPVAPGITIPLVAKFQQSPAFIYFVAAFSVASFYGLVTGLFSVYALMKKEGNSIKQQLQIVMLDVLLLGIVAAATGAAGGVAYIGLKGNKHTKWNKICNTFDSFCFHAAASIILSLISSIALLLLIWLSLYAISKKIATR